MSKHILKTKTLQTERITAQDLDRVKSDKILQYDPLPNLDEDGDLVHKKWLDDALLGLGGGGSARLISSNLIITSSTAGSLSAVWVDFTSETESLTDEPLTFNGGGLPAAGTFRFDLVQGLDDGTVEVKEGADGDGSAGTQPSADAGKVALAMVLWNELGEGEVVPPDTENDWSVKRFSTQVEPDTTGKYAKVWEADLSAWNNYGLELSYQEPINPLTPFAGSGQRNLKLSFTCDGDRNIVPETMQIETDGGQAGEFVLYQLADNIAALYHKSNHYWGRIEFRILFQNSSFLLADFVNNGPYGLAPGSPLDTWESVVNSGSGGGLTIPEIVTGLEAITEEEDKLDASAIKNLPTVEPVQDEFTWTTGAQEFTLSEAVVGKPVVFVNTTHLRESKWSITAGVVTITDTLPNPSIVVIHYFKTALISGYPDVNLSAENFFQLVADGTVYIKGGNVPQSTAGGITLTFRKDTMYGTPAAPVSGEITEDFTGDHVPNVGAEAILWYNDATLDFASATKYKRIHGTFEAGELNKIIFRYYSDTYITYEVYQEL